MTTTTFDSGGFQVQGIRADRKTPMPWSPEDGPSIDAIGAPKMRPRTNTSNLRIVQRSAGAPTAWAPPPPIVTKGVMQLFQLGLAAMVLIAIYIL